MADPANNYFEMCPGGKLPDPSSPELTLAQVEIAWFAMMAPESDFRLAFERAGKNEPTEMARSSTEEARS